MYFYVKFRPLSDELHHLFLRVEAKAHLFSIHIQHITGQVWIEEACCQNSDNAFLKVVILSMDMFRELLIYVPSFMAEALGVFRVPANKTLRLPRTQHKK